MGSIICVASQKGGTGKTTTAVNLATSLALLEKETLLVDCDPLGNATTGVGIDKGSLSHDLFDALTGRVSAREILADTPLDRLQVIPARIGLHHTEKHLSGTLKPELRLKEVLKHISNEYAFTIVDAPPAFGFLTRSALAASDHLLLPLQRQIFSFEGLAQLLLMVRGIQKSLNPGLKISGVFYTMCRNPLGNHPASDSVTLDFLKHKLLKTVIPWDDALASAADRTMPLALLDILSKGSIAYMQLARELMDVLAGDN